MDGKGMNQQRMVLGGRVVKTEEGYGWGASEDDEVYEHGGLFGEADAESNKKKKVVVADGDVVAKRGSSVAPPPPPPPPPPPGAGSGGTKGGTCQAEKCTADLTDAKAYHRRHKVCEHHAKAQVVLINGHRQRFCQQCSRFHDLSEFDDTKRSCRRRLAGHNERRRKNAAAAAAAAVATAESPGGEGSSSSRGKGVGSHQLKDMVCGQVNQRGRIRITIQENATYQHFQIR